jgi:hypothetical protein
MEKLKSLDEVLKQDPRNSAFVLLETLAPPTLEDHYNEIADVVVNPGVPEEVRSYFATVQNVCLYGWCAYDLYAVVQFLCATTIEFALRKKFPVSGKDRRGLSELMKLAVSKRLISEKGFSHIRVMRQEAADRLRMDRSIMKVSGKRIKTDFPRILASTIPMMRNAFAHPRGHSIAMPSEAIVSLRLTAELVNQLFATGKKSKC